MSTQREIDAWFRELVAQWRRAWSSASQGTRDRVSNSLQYLAPPLQATIYLRSHSDAPIQASAVILGHDSARPDLDIEVSIIDDTCHAAEHHHPFIFQLDSTCTRMRNNLTPDRPVAPPPEPWELSAQRVDDGTIVWIIAADPTTIDIEKFVAFCFRDELPRADVPLAGPPARHLYALGMERERVAIPRWLTLYADQLVVALGLQESFWSEHGVLRPWWCGLNFSRRAVFDGTDDGDIDYLAGPLQLSLTADEWVERFRRETHAWPLDTPRSMIVDMALRRACAEGFIVWPPRTDLLVACEAKASWYDTERRIWKATHAGEARRLKGQITFLLDRGVDRVGVLHLGATKPRQTETNPWFQAAADHALAEEALGCLAPLFGFDELPGGCGYFRAVLGAVPHKTEDMAGAGGELRILQAARPNPASAYAPRAWRAKLQDRLAALPRPLSPHVYITPCPNCERWNLSRLPLPTCSCAPPPAP